MPRTGRAGTAYGSVSMSARALSSVSGGPDTAYGPTMRAAAGLGAGAGAGGGRGGGGGGGGGGGRWLKRAWGELGALAQRDGAVRLEGHRSGRSTCHPLLGGFVLLGRPACRCHVGRRRGRGPDTLQVLRR